MSLTVDETLDLFHRRASDADVAYFKLFIEDAVFIGTDATERWTLSAFKEYALPYFEKGQGWTYLPVTRHVNFSPDRTIAWFDEILDNQRFGTTRSSGVLIQTQDGWKVSQYHLTVPIPNDKMDDVVKVIRGDE